MLHASATLPAAARRPLLPAPVVYIVDDDVYARESLALLFDEEGWNAEPLDSPAAFLSRPRTAASCCLVLEASPACLELQRQLSGRSEIPIVFITSHGDVATTVQAMKAGAFDFLTRPVDLDVLRSVVREAFERSSEMQALQACHAALTARERDVMALVVSGLLNKQVGAALGISEITVKAHRGQVMRKMNASSLPDLVTMATRLGVRRPS